MTRPDEYRIAEGDGKFQVFLGNNFVGEKESYESAEALIKHLKLLARKP